METAKKTFDRLTNEDVREWFEGYISGIRFGQIMLETDTASPEKKQFYNDAISGNELGLHSYARTQSTKYFIKNIVSDYFKELQKFKLMPQRLAFDFSEAKILVWAQIADDDESTEDALILAEAEANAKYSDNGFYVSSTIVEESDNLKVPGHYNEIRIDGRLSSAYQKS